MEYLQIYYLQIDQDNAYQIVSRSQFKISDNKMRRKHALSQLMLLAQQCLQNKQPQNSIKILHQVLQVEPKNSQAYRLLADCFDEMGEKEQAQINYKISIDCNPFSTICYINYGLLLYNWGKMAEAEKVYEQCMAIDGNDKTLLNNYAILLYQMGKMDEAQKMIKRCLKVDPDNQNCAMYLQKIRNSKALVPVDLQKAQAGNSQQKLLLILFERDQKLAQKQQQVKNLKFQLSKKEEELIQLKLQLSKMKKQKLQQGSLRQCKICLNKAAIFANRKCGHLSACKDCLAIIKRSCPICRSEGSFIRVYSSLIREEVQ